MMIAESEIKKRIIGSSIGLREVCDWILWWGRLLGNERKDVKSTAHGKENMTLYTWTGSHLIMEQFGTSDLKQGAAEAIGE
jgi:hypothetical protein